MKNLYPVFLFALVIIVCFSVSVFAGNKTIVSGVLQINTTSTPPVIDGQLDDIWSSTTATPMVLFEGGPADSAASLNDHFSTFRVLWDNDYFYCFVSVVDDSLDGSDKVSPWLNDAVEIFFDGSNEKATSYDNNDQQWRWVYGEVPGDPTNASNGPGEWVWQNTQVGYNFELRIYRDSLKNVNGVLFPMVADREIGFEISNADRDGGTRNEVLHWWTTDGLTWNNPSLFGTAILSATEATTPINILKATEPITIDGNMDSGEGWDAAIEMSMDKLEGNPPVDSTYVTWKDHLSFFKVMWDDNYFYCFVTVVDDSLDGSDKVSPWLNDAVEIFFDGSNEKATSYDNNDQQWRWVYGEVPGDPTNASNGPGEWVWQNTALGYNFELRIDKDSLKNANGVLFPLVMDREIGFEISNANRAGGVRQDVRHWWTTDGLTWNNPSLFGTALLYEKVTGVADQSSSIITGYDLKQNYPNPFNPSTEINYTISKNEHVKISVYNVLGNKVADLVNGFKNAGSYTVRFNADNLSSGVYFYKLETGSMVIAKKMMLIK